MSVAIKAHFDGLENPFTVLRMQFGFHQKTDETHRPIGKPRGTIFELVIETTKQEPFFFQWASQTDQKLKKVDLVITPTATGSKTRKIELQGVHCVGHQTNFNAVGSYPMTTLLKLSPAVMLDGGEHILEHYWKE